MAENMDLWIEKANVLVEALPYIREFNGKKIVVKYGGSAMTDSHLKKSVITDVALLKLIGMKPIIVHGGGKEISKWVRLSGQTPQFVNGLRVTDKSTMEIAEMVLGKVNKGLVQYMEENGVKACGISGKDGGTMRVVKKQLASGQDIGFVGEVTKVDTSLIDTLLDQDFIPVICPIGLGEEDFKSYNVNADDAACAIAVAEKANKLAFLSDISGNAHFRADDRGCTEIHRIRQRRRRNAAEAPELHFRDTERRLQSAYSGRESRALASSGVLYGQRCRHK